MPTSRERSNLRPLSVEIKTFAENMVPAASSLRPHLEGWAARARALERAELDQRKVLTALIRERDQLEMELNKLKPQL